jgi:signal recognition particle receptor subunit beta
MTHGREGEAVSNPPNSFHIGQPVSAAPVAVEVDPSTSAGEQGDQLFTSRQIGSDLEAFRRELVSCGQALRTAAPFRGVSFIDDSLHLLARLTCRIAIVGQVKAGKSSFINALVQRPTLLPTDVNPWTTAITHLHFGRADAPANVAAQFTFFEPNEWEHLARGGGYIRELTQRFVPGFEVELLEKHVDAMRRRSEERLGSGLGDLLGKKHVFPALSNEILERYVCSGAFGLPGTESEQKGLYSDVVKWADLYFRSNDFSFPTTIIDTPGTNDPFLVRDEITRRALETADIYIVVLTARQALSSADVALLRILRGLNKERIAVFINRIDELGDLVRDTPAIVQHVQAGLRREFPTSEIPIVAGSASWAMTATGGPQAEIDREMSAKAKAYAAYLAQQTNLQPLLSVASGPNEQLAQTLLLCSGLPTMSHLLGDLTLRSHAGHVLRQISRSFSELVQVGYNAASHEIKALQSGEELNPALHRHGEEELRAIDTEATEIDRLTVELQGLLTDLQGRTDKVIEDRCEKMIEGLRDAVQGFAELECEDLRQAIEGGQRSRVWKCQTTTLRQTLEQRFVSSCREAEREISKLESFIFPKLKQLLSRHYPQWRQPGEDGGQGAGEPPSLSALSRIVVLDLEEPWWKRWWIGMRDPEERIAELDRLIRHEFYPIVDELVLASRTHLKAQQSSTLQRSTRVYMGLVEIMQEQSRARRARTRVLMTAGDTLHKTELRRNRETALKMQISTMDLLIRKLQEIDQTWGEKIG